MLLIEKSISKIYNVYIYIYITRILKHGQKKYHSRSVNDQYLRMIDQILISVKSNDPSMDIQNNNKI